MITVTTADFHAMPRSVQLDLEHWLFETGAFYYDNNGPRWYPSKVSFTEGLITVDALRVPDGTGRTTETPTSLQPPTSVLDWCRQRASS